jgi:hypothetical protein
VATEEKQAWLYVGSTALTGGEFLKLTSTKGQVDLASAVTDIVVGVVAEACSAGNVTPQNVSIKNPANCPGTVQVIASTSVSVLAPLGVTTGGKVVTVAGNATGTATLEFIVGFAAEAAGADGDVIEMLWPVALTHSVA